MSRIKTPKTPDFIKNSNDPDYLKTRGLVFRLLRLEYLYFRVDSNLIKVKNRRRTSLTNSRRSRDALMNENDVIAGNALRRNYADSNDRNIREQYQIRINKYKGFKIY